MKSVDIPTNLPKNMIIPDDVLQSLLILPTCTLCDVICPRVRAATKDGKEITITLNNQTRGSIRGCSVPCFPKEQEQAIVTFN